MATSHAKIPQDVQDRLKDGAIGDYKIIGTIGAGGMGAVFRCRDKKLRREVAVKLLLHCVDGRNVQRFLEEARILAKLSHPNVVQVYDVDYDGHVPFFVMELVQGESVAQLLDRLGRLEIEQARRIIAQTASGLAAVHALGVIHRDIKAANVIVRPDGGVKLLDFGIARPVENAPQLTSSGLVMGTPSSMAPEQLRGEELDQRADIYALGVLYYQVLTGQRPYEGDDPQNLADQQEARLPTPVKQLRPDVPDDIARVVARALGRRKDDRYWNCEEMIKDLGEVPSLGTGTGTGLSRVGAAISKLKAPDSLGRPRQKPYAAMGVAVVAVLAMWILIAKSMLWGCVVCETPIAGVEGQPSLASRGEGVFLWHDGSGWHVRAKAASAKRELSGVLRVSGGALTGVSPIDEASADALTVEGRRAVHFRFDDPAAGTGFDARVESAACVELDVTSAGAPAPHLTYIGRDAAPPPSLPARFCP